MLNFLSGVIASPLSRHIPELGKDCLRSHLPGIPVKDVMIGGAGSWCMQEKLFWCLFELSSVDKSTVLVRRRHRDRVDFSNKAAVASGS